MDYCINMVQKHEFTKINVLINKKIQTQVSCSVTLSLCEQLLTFWRIGFSTALRTTDTTTQYNVSEELNHLQHHCKALKSNTITMVLLTYNVT
jgi:hypothetical protein